MMAKTGTKPPEIRNVNNEPMRRKSLVPWFSGQEIVLVLVIGLLWTFLAVSTDTFFKYNSIMPLFSAVAPIGLIAIGMTAIIATGGIDISVGTGLLLVSAILSKLLVRFDPPILATVIIALCLGSLLGLLNGLLTALGRVHPIIITFGTSNLFLFFAVQIIGSGITGIPRSEIFSSGPGGRFLGVPLTVIIMILVAIIATWYVRNRPSGRHLLAIGGDENTARLVGIPVRRLTISVYVFTGCLVGLGALFSLGLGTSTLTSDQAHGSELAVIAAVIIGGTSITGGNASVFGALLGAVLVTTVATGTTHLGLSSTLSDLFAGVLIIIAVAIEQVRGKKRSGGLE